MKKTTTSFLACAVMAALTGSVSAKGEVGDFNYNETTGIINIPAARVAPAGSFQWTEQIQALMRGQRDFSYNPSDYDDFLYNDGDTKFLWGAGGGLEFSLMLLHAGTQAPVFGVKWEAVADAEDHPAFAIGAQSLDVRPQPVNPHPPQWDHGTFFGVLGHWFPLNEDGMGFELQAGIGTGRLAHGFFGGQFHFSRELALAAEYDGTIKSAAIKWYPNDRWMLMSAVQFQHPYTTVASGPNDALTYYNQISPGTQIHVGLTVSYTFGNAGEPGAPEWARNLDKSHVPQTDALLIQESEHTAPMIQAAAPKRPSVVQETTFTASADKPLTEAFGAGLSVPKPVASTNRDKPPED